MARLTKKEILNLTPADIEHMRRTNLTQLKQITSDIQAINRKSYLRSKAAGIESPFVSAYERSGGPASLKSFRGSSNEAAQVKAEFESQMSLLQSKTRTFKGAQKVYSEMARLIDPEHKKFAANIRDMNKDEVKQFWDVYHKFAQSHVVQTSSVTNVSPPESISSIILSELNSDDDVDDILKRVDEAYNKLYQQREAENNNDINPDPFVL